MTTPRMLRFSLLACASLLLATGAAAQFGKNKVQYRSFDWYYIQTDHLDVYFYPGGEYLANFVANEGEKALANIEATLDYQIIARIPIVVYNCHNEFQQTNVVGEYLEEGIGGVTEMFKNRVVIPFEGSYSLFRHVIHHELTHAVLNEMFYGGSIQSMISNNIQLQLPIWMNEGLAEYTSLGGWDTHSDQFMRDATINTYVPKLEELSGYFAYRGGQSFWYYIARRYGREKVGEILNRIRSTRSVEIGMQSAVGMDIEEVSKEWQLSLKKMYWPDIATREASGDIATRLTDHRKDRSFYNTSPAISPNGDKLAYISDRSDYFDVYVQSLVTDKLTKVVSGNRSKNFEELHLLTPGLAWSADNRRLALAAKAGDQDAIYVIDAETGDDTKLDFRLDGIGTVAWSPTEADKFAFVGNKNGQSDIYLYDVATHALTNLTDDVFSDTDPAFSSDGTAVFFSSDRDSLLPVQADSQRNFRMWQHNFESLSIYRLDLATRTVTRVTDHPGFNDVMPLPCSDGKTLLYVSDRNGINNIYKHDLATGADVPITNSLSGIDQITISRDNQKLVFAAMNYAGFDLYLMHNPFERTVKGLPLEPTAFEKERARMLHPDSAGLEPATPPDTLHGYGPYDIDVSAIAAPPTMADVPVSRPRVATAPPVGNVDENGNYRVQKYKLSFSPDLIYATGTYNTFFGLMGSTAMLFSDMLGDNQIFFSANLFADLRNSTFALAYLYLPNHIDYAFEAFHSAQFLAYTDGTAYRFRQWGGLFEAQYPIDKFNRVDGTLTWLNLSREDLNLVLPTLQHMVVMPQLSYVHDDVLWGPVAPFDGMRYNLTVTASPPLGGNTLSFYSVGADVRRYFKFLHDYSFAMRVAGGGSFGPNAQRYAMGGVANWFTAPPTYLIQDDQDFAFLTLALPLRGFPYGQEVGTKFAMANFEMRYPFIRLLVPGVLPLSLQNVYGTLFFDVGSAWTSNADYRGTETLADGTVRARDLLMGTGFGARMFFLFFLLKLDVAWAYNLQGFSVPQYIVSIGEDF